jgi:uridine nucleosidase
MLFELLVFFSSTYETVFGLTTGPPLHDPLAVAVLLSTLNPVFAERHPVKTLKFDDRDGERFTVNIITDGLHSTDVEAIGQLGRSVAVEAEQAGGVTIPRGVELDAFWDMILESIARADECNKARGSPLYESHAHAA